MLRTKLIASGMVLLLSTSSLALPPKKKVTPRPPSTIDTILDYASSHIVPIVLTAGAASVVLYFVIRGRVQNGQALAPAGAVLQAINQQRALLQAQHNAVANQGGGRNDAAPHAGSTASVTAGAAMLRSVALKTKVEEPAVAPKTKQAALSETILERVQRHATKLQGLLALAATLNANEDPPAELLRQITDLQAVIIAHIGIDMWENGDFEKAVAEPFFWELFAHQGNWLFEGLTTEQFAAALQHLNDLANREQAMELLLKLENALLITKGMKVSSYLCRLKKLKLLIDMRDLVFMRDQIGAAVLQVATRTVQHDREIEELTVLLK